VTAVLLEPGETDLEQAFDYYNGIRATLGADFIEEFRRAVDRILAHPRAWQSLDSTYRRCRLRRFPYGIIYRVDDHAQEIVIVAIMHLSRNPDAWRRRVP
jgi:plasmid stabilization system protein ParE